MPKIEPEVEAFARIKVAGVGGGGGNAVQHMINSKVRGVEFLVMNTDVQDLHKSIAKKKIHLGKNLTKGLGAGMNPDTGKRAAEETKAEIQDALKGADMVFIAGGMGGGTGTGATPIVARAAREIGALTVAVVTKPFFFEGTQRMNIADNGLMELKDEVDALIIIPNDRLLTITKKEVTVDTAFSMSDDVLRQAVEGISDLITSPGIINVDFADIKSVMSSAGSALMGIGQASGEKRAEEAAKLAINSPLLDLSINGAQGVLFAISGGADLALHEVQEAARVITETIDKDAKVIFGTTHDTKLDKGHLKVTVIATGFPENAQSKPLFPEQAKGDNKKDDSGSKTINNAKKEDILNAFQSAQSSPRQAPSISSGTTRNNAPETISDVEDDDWNAIPAFLRRQKK
jgi:cell division protein FtsZ